MLRNYYEALQADFVVLQQAPVIKVYYARYDGLVNNNAQDTPGSNQATLVIPIADHVENVKSWFIRGLSKDTSND